MKKSFKLILILLLIGTVFSCKKDNSTQGDNYCSIANFFALHGTPMQTYIIDGTTGGSFTTPNGTNVSIPANAFMTQSGTPVTGNVTIKFKDIYKKSEMLLNDISTNLYNGRPIKSAGMFYIKAMQGTQALLVSLGSKITINQPLNGLPVDTAMRALIFRNIDSAFGWLPPPVDTAGRYMDSLRWSSSNYIFSLYQFNSPIDSGSWCNSDDPSYFSTYPQTNLTLQPLDNYIDYSMDLFLVFSNVNSMVHVYGNGTNFPYYYAPVGLQCTVVVVGVKNGKLYSSFTPITISSNLTVNFSLSVTTTTEFKTKLNALN